MLSNSPKFLLIIFYLSISTASAELQIFPVPSDAKAAPDYKITVNGQEVFVYNSAYNPFAIFNFSDNIHVEISTVNDLKWVNIRPLSDSIQWKINGNSVEFNLDHPANLSIELNNESERAIFLFAGDIYSPDLTDGNVITYAGGKTYNAGSIELKSNDILYIEGGAIVKGNIHADHANNIKILGDGILDGTLSDLSRTRRMIDLTGCQNVLIQNITILNSPTWTIVPTFCTDVAILNVKQINWKFGSDGIDLVGSSHVRIDACFLKNNDDCIVIKSFRSEKNVQDSIESTPPNVTDITVNNCTLWNMQWGNALEIGFELQCDSISRVNFNNINIIHVERGSAISIHNGDFAVVTDIEYKNINIENANHKLIDLAIFLSQYSLDRPESGEERTQRYLNGAWDGVLKVYKGEEQKYEAGRGYINQIRFSNVRVLEGPYPFSIIAGFNVKHMISDIIFDNLEIMNQKIISPGIGHFFISDAENIVFK